jgi:hypothetical protein
MKKRIPPFGNKNKEREFWGEHDSSEYLNWKSAKQAMADPQARAHYEKLAKKTDRIPFRLAVCDYFKGIDLLKPKP